MELELHYVNKIKEAKIKLNGLTVIAGANSSGKSTVGRTLFTVVKAIANTKRVDNNMNKVLLQKHIDSFYSRLESFNVWEDLPSKTEFSAQLNYTENKKEYILGIKNRLSFFKKIVPRERKLLEDDLNKLEDYIDQMYNSEVYLKNEMQYLIESEFSNSFSSAKNEYESTVIKLKSEGRFSVSFLIDDVYIRNVSSQDEAFFYYFDDTTYIESPLYIHLSDVILNAQTWREIEGRPSSFDKPMVPSHIKDMVEKIIWAARYADHKATSSSINLNDITGGQLTYDPTANQLVYKEGSQTFKTINVASGIKSLSIIQLLEDAKIIGPNSILIWDEPENHLHPEWQIVFAEKLVELAKNGVPILVTTHSPYFLQAIRTYSTREEMEDFVNFYTPVEGDDHLETIVDVTDDLTPVFATLAEPMNKIMDING